MAAPAEPLFDRSVDPPVRGLLHLAGQPRAALVLTHGAGSSSQAPLLIALGETLSDAGVTVLRCDLPFRQEKSFGPPRPGNAERDRLGLRNAVEMMRTRGFGPIFLGGHSYGGRQATMLCAEDQDLAAGLMLMSYPLHPPGKPQQLRTQHFPKLVTNALFVHGTRDPFGSVEEIEPALKLIPAKTLLLPVEGAGHDLGFKGKQRNSGLPARILAAFQGFFSFAGTGV